MQISILSIHLGLLAVISQAIPTIKNEHLGDSPSLPNGEQLAVRDNYARPANQSNSLYAFWNCDWTALDPKDCHTATVAMDAIMKNASYQVDGVGCLNATVGSTIAFFCAEPTVEDLTETFSPNITTDAWAAVESNCMANRGGIVGNVSSWVAGTIGTNRADLLQSGLWSSLAL